ncbi:MAG TPA: extracellular solute-binding protein, partial [Gemmatimonadales bacterium]|nr:extracellular solute-binding protein [Gemmatimonadales bacterium]
QIPWTAAHEKLLTAYVGNATPDLAQLGNTWIPEFVALNALLPLDSLDAGSAEVRDSSYFPGIWQTNLVNGGLYGIPWYVDTRVLFYRKDLLAQAGFSQPPTTWARWREAMRALKARGGPGRGRYAIFAPFNEWNVPVILGLQAGSPLLKDGGRYGAFGEPPFRRAFDFYLDWYESGVAPLLGINDIGNVYQEFERGTFAMWITGPWNIGEFRRRLPRDMQDKWSTAPLPGPEGAASGVSMAGGSSVVLFRRSHHHAEAWQLAEYLSRPEQQLRFFRLTGDLPARTEAWRDSALASDPAAHAFWEQLQRVVPLPQVPEWELIATRVFDYTEQAVRGGGGVSTDSTLAHLDREVDRILARRRWLLSRAGRTTTP